MPRQGDGMRADSFAGESARCESNLTYVEGVGARREPTPCATSVATGITCTSACDGPCAGPHHLGNGLASEGSQSRIRDCRQLFPGGTSRNFACCNFRPQNPGL